MRENNFYISVIYITSHLFGLLAGLNMLATPISQGTPMINQEPSSGLYLIGMIVAATGLMLLLYKLNSKLLIKLWFNSAVVLTTYLFFSSFMGSGKALGPTIALFLVRVMAPGNVLKNLADIFSYAGAGALFGTMIGFVPAFIFLLFLGVYDILSVFFTGHMVSLALESLDTDTFMGIVFENSGEEEINIEEVKEKRNGGRKDIESSVGVVGGGDIIAPMIFSVSLLKNFPLTSSVFTSVGSMLGLMFLMNKSSKNRFYPAIPVVGGAGIAGFLLSLFFI